jgi:hypothetical protein
MKSMFVASAVCALACTVFGCGQSSSDFGGVDPTPTPTDDCKKNPDRPCYPTDDVGTAPRQGNTAGQRIANLQFYGFKNVDPSQRTDPGGEPQKVSLADFYDPTGTTFKVIHLIGSSNWCPPCNAETEALAARAAADLASRGVVFLQALIDGPVHGVGATPDVLRNWIQGPRKDENRQVYNTPLNFTVVLDPDTKVLGPFFNANSVPVNLTIDARSMEILTARTGSPPDIAADVQEWLNWMKTHPAKGAE